MMVCPVVVVVVVASCLSTDQQHASSNTKRMVRSSLKDQLGPDEPTGQWHNSLSSNTQPLPHTRLAAAAAVLSTDNECTKKNAHTVKRC
uniref:Putative secreted protein n=1 Tax=Anopheles darlingi TaxID=43151 RepID=A0A2M4DK21_ANODA